MAVQLRPDDGRQLVRPALDVLQQRPDPVRGPSHAGSPCSMSHRMPSCGAQSHSGSTVAA